MPICTSGYIFVHHDSLNTENVTLYTYKDRIYIRGGLNVVFRRVRGRAGS